MKKRFLLLMSMLMLFNINLFSQSRAVTGTVTSAEDGSTLIGVTVVIKGTTSGVTTDADGEYNLMVTSENTTLVFSFIGLKTKEIAVTANKNSYDVILEPSDLNLDEFVVTAMGISRKKETLGYSVQDVSGDELAEVKPTNIVNGLSGKIAGVQITNATGAPGGASRIVIRGNGSFTDSEPLWVVDGTPFINFSADNGPMSGADFGNGALDIDPSNIESISVLKGANAAALYGSRAANGVILVTTKRGKASKGFGVEVSSAITFDAYPYLPDYQNEYGGGSTGSEYYWNQHNAENGTNLSYQQYAEQYGYNFVDGQGAGVNDATPSSWGPRLDAGLMLDQFTGENQPWVSRPNNVRDFYETGITTDNSISVSNAGEFGSVRAFFNDNNVVGTLPNTDYRKHTFGFNSDVNLHERLKLSTNLNYVINKSDNLPAQGYYGDAPNSPQTGVTFMPRQVDIKPLEENWNSVNEFGYPYNFGRGESPNPYLAARNTNSRVRNRIYGNVVLDFKLTDWLTIRGRAGTDQYNENRKTRILELTYRATDGSGLNGTFNDQNLMGEETNFDFMAMFDKSLGDFRVDGTMGANMMTAKRMNNSIFANDLVVPNLFTISNAKGVQGVTQFESEKQIHGIYGAVNASYRDYLYLSLTARNDWSSTLPANERSYFYPSFSLGLVFTEALDISSDFFTFGKIRGGWASVGRDTSPYSIQPTYQPLGSPWEGNGIFTLPGTLPNQLLKPELSKSIEIGGNFKFFNNRIGLDISYYNVRNTNQILNVAVSQASGYNQVAINAGEIQNTGVEIILNTTPIQNNDFSWDVDINWAKNNNSVNSLFGDLETYRMSSMWGANIEARPGQAFGTIIGNSYLRDDSGNIVVSNSGRIRRENNQELGNITPDWIGGITNTFRYKNMSLRVLVDAKMGGDFVAGSIRWGGSGGALAFTAEDNLRETGHIWDAVTVDGEPNTNRISAQQYISDYSRTVQNWVVDGSYVKLREVSLGYRFRTPASYSVRLSLIGRNLSILYRHKENRYGLDPETGSGSGIAGLGYEQMQIPSARNIGARVTFSF